MGEAVLSLRIDWWKDRFAVNLQSPPQGLPDLLCVCNEITKLPEGPLGSQPEREPRTAAALVRGRAWSHISRPSTHSAARRLKYEFNKLEISLGGLHTIVHCL